MFRLEISETLEIMNFWTYKMNSKNSLGVNFLPQLSSVTVLCIYFVVFLVQNQFLICKDFSFNQISQLNNKNRVSPCPTRRPYSPLLRPSGSLQTNSLIENQNS